MLNKLFYGLGYITGGIIVVPFILYGVILFLFPRFVSERILLGVGEDGVLHMLALEEEYTPEMDNYIAATGVTKYFNLFGFVLFPKLILDEDKEK